MDIILELFNVKIDNKKTQLYINWYKYYT
jgi:hypothetical protein